MNTFANLARPFAVLIASAFAASPVLADHGGGSHINVNLSAPSSSSTGTYTVSWSNNADPQLDEKQYLEQKTTGSYVTVYQGYNGSKSFQNKPDGTYRYRVRYEMCFGFFCSDLYSQPVTVVVSSQSSTNDSFGFLGTFAAKKGDLNGDGRKDIYIYPTSTPSGMTPASPVILTQTANLEFVDIGPLSLAEKATGSSWPASQLRLEQTDLNVDGLADIAIVGLGAEAGFNSSTHDLILYGDDAPTKPTRSMDSDFVSFFEQTQGWMSNPNYFEIEAINNGWYSYQGTLTTGYFSIAYIDFYYNYGSLDYLDGDDDPYDPSSIPTICVITPLQCFYIGGVWRIYGTFLANIQIVYDYSNFNLPARQLATESSGEFHQQNESSTQKTNAVSAIFEGVIGNEIGSTAREVLNKPLQLPPELPSGAPKPQMPESPWDPENPQGGANDPNSGNNSEFKTKNIWRILGRINIIGCGLLFCTADAGDPDEVLVMEWYHFGWMWGQYQLGEEGIDPESDPFGVVIGETEGSGQLNRIPNAAATYGAIYYDPGEFSIPENYSQGDEKFLWAMNWGLIELWKNAQATFYDIGLYNGRFTRGRFYPCERKVLIGYANRQQKFFGGTLNWNAGTCEIFPSGQ